MKYPMQHTRTLRVTTPTYLALLALLGSALAASAQDVAFVQLGTFELGFSEPADLAYTDFDGDGNIDVVVSEKGEFEQFGGSGLTVLRGDGNGGWIEDFIIETNSIRFGNVVAEDFNGDGNPDIVYARIRVSGGTSVFSPAIVLGDGNGGFGTWSNVFFGGLLAANDVATADMNLDSIPDVIWTDSTNDWISVALGIGDGTFAPPIDVSATNASSLAIADMNQDSFPDVVVTGGATQQPKVFIYLGDGTGHLTLASSSSGFDGRVDIGHFNGDDFPDVITRRVIRFGMGDGTLSAAQALTSDSIADIAVADFDRDGLDDVAMIAGATNAPFRVYRSLGGGAFAQPVFFTSVLTQPRIFDAVDLNGDLLPDLLQTARNLGQNTLLTVHLNTSQVCVLPGDADGDGDVDLSDLALVLSQFGMVGAGLAGDLDNDGAVDISDLAIVLANFGATCP